MLRPVMPDAAPPPTPLSPDALAKIDAYWRAANYLSVGQIYLLDNPLLRRPLVLEDVKRRLLGHWGTTPGQNFVYAHLNRVIRERDLSMIYIAGPGHGGPAVVGNVYLEGTYSEVYPHVTQDERGLLPLVQAVQLSRRHPQPRRPRNARQHPRGRRARLLALSHAFGAAFDDPDLVVACVIGDGEAETGPLATSWHSNKFLNPATDGAVLPILHLNGYKIANPTIFARIPRQELTQMLRGCGWEPHYVDHAEREDDDNGPAHEAMAATLDRVLDEINRIQHAARVDGETARPRWPMIVLATPKGWTGPRRPTGRRSRAPSAPTRSR